MRVSLSRILQLSVATLSLAAAGGTARAETQLNYWLWDALQAPHYAECAAAFTAKHPDITVKVTQYGWLDYWTTLSTGFVSGEAPDVFADHLRSYPEFVANSQIMDLTPMVERDKVDTKIYSPGLVDLWTRDGKLYGMPKDWDTVALVYNKEMLDKAGVTVDELRAATWNPKDGGSFEKILARLSLDASGKRGDEAGFDPKNVVQYGLITPKIDGYGQTQWSWLAVSAGFKFTDGPWGTKYHYDDPVLAETLTWLRDLSLKKGYGLPQKDVGALGGTALLGARKGAIVADGSWNSTWYGKNVSFAYGFVPLPTGPQGRKSMFNGLGDSIWTGTKHPDEAWEWVKFLGSADCQGIIGKAGVVFPAIPAAAKIAQDAFATRGQDVTAFTSEATPDQTFLYPITDFSPQILSTMNVAFDRIFLEDVPVAPLLKEANDQVNALFE